jgi:predicted RND superfamily exporter protein
MRILLTILAVLASIIALVLSILPFGNLALIPIAIAFVCAFLAMNLLQKEKKSTNFIKVLFLAIIIALSLTIYRSLFTTNEVIENEQTIENEKQSEEDAIKELDDISLDD